MVFLQNTFRTSHELRHGRVPKELISRFVKLCPTCQVRRGTSRNSPPPIQDTKEVPDSEAPENIEEAQSPMKLGKKSAPGSQETGMMSMPVQLVNGSSTFQSQSRWMAGFHTPQTTYEEVYIPATTDACMPSFPSINGIETFETITTTQSSRSLPAMSIAIPTDTRVTSGFEERFKQDTRYCFEQ